MRDGLGIHVRKTEKMVWVETQYGQPLRELLLDWLNRGKSLEAISGLCDVSRPTLYRWLREFGVSKRTRWVSGRGEETRNRLEGRGVT